MDSPTAEQTPTEASQPQPQQPQTASVPAEVESPFAGIPRWLEKYVELNAATMGRLEELQQKRVDEGKHLIPWTIYLESIALGRGFTIESVVAHMSRFHNYQVIPANIGYLEPKDYSEFFPDHVSQKYYALPVSLTETFLNVALLEPEVARFVYTEFYQWLGDRKLKAVQFFITPPTAYGQYKAHLDRLRARREQG